MTYIFDNAEFNTFFTSDYYMGLSDHTHGYFFANGILDPNDLPNFTKEGTEAIF